MSRLSAPSGTQLHGDDWASSVATRAATLGVCVCFGQSLLIGSGPDGTRGGQTLASVHPGITPTYYLVGTLTTTYPTATGPIPRLFDLMGVEDTTPLIINEAISGVAFGNVLETQIPNARATLVTAGITPADVVLAVLMHGTSAADNVDEARRYSSEDNERMARIIEAEYPNAILAVGTSPTQDAADTQAAVIRTGQRNVAGRRGNRRLFDNVLPTLIALQGDDVHPTEGPGGGSDALADRLWAAVAT